MEPSREENMEWFRWYHGAISDPKWPLIARKSGQNIGTVVSVWAAVLEYASQADERGCVDGFNPESVDALFGYEDGATEKVVEAMKNQCVISVTPCNANETHDVTGVTLHVVSWEKRQVKRERDDNSLERVRAHRMKKKAQQNEDVSKEKPNETPCNASVTPRNTQNRTEQNREEKKNTYTQEFEKFWSAYPSRQGKKVGKKEAFAEWQRAMKDVQAEFLISQIESLAPQYGEYPVDACRWLKHRRWEDEITEATSCSDQFAGVI